jgi:hypothetical protein
VFCKVAADPKAKSRTNAAVSEDECEFVVKDEEEGE